MNANQQTIKQWEEQEALHRFQLISPLLRENLDDAKKLQLRKQIAKENEISVRSLYRYEKAGIQRRTVFRAKTGNQEETAITETAREL